MVLDDYDGGLPYDTLLRLCDRYPMIVPVKGGHVPFLAKRVISTSNIGWSEGYPTYLAFQGRGWRRWAEGSMRSKYGEERRGEEGDVMRTVRVYNVDDGHTLSETKGERVPKRTPKVRIE